MGIFNQRVLFSGFEGGVIETIRQLPKELYYLRSGGSFVDVDSIRSNDVFQIHFRLLGGKGGFGSILRSFRISKSSNKLMCRTLTGRRLADVEEERRLRKWAAKKAEREKEKQRKKKEKYEKLKQGGPKHQFADVDYLRKRDLVLDQTEDAIEAGISGLDDEPAQPEPEAEKVEQVKETESSDDDNDTDGPFITLTTKKRKLASIGKENDESKKAKLEQTPIIPISTITIPDNTKKSTTSSASKKPTSTSKDHPKPHMKPEQPAEKTDYEAVDLNKFNSAEELYALGLGHLKHALESRGLKCGGTLEERAVRLFSVKGLKPKKYPKKILAAKKTA